MPALAPAYRSVRAETERRARPLSPEDRQLQSAPWASPTKWHLAHTSWFFRTFLLGDPADPRFPPDLRVLFNSYYEGVGPQHPRPARGLLSRPSSAEVEAYRRDTDERMDRLLETLPESAVPLVKLGLSHEQQHQELLWTDILHAFSQNPRRPVVDAEGPRPRAAQAGASWLSFEGGLVEVGHQGPSFAFDNEGPRHRVWLEPFRISSQLVTNAELLAFIQAGGYQNPGLWLSDGYDWVRALGQSAPLYTRVEGDRLLRYGLSGERPTDLAEPACHLSFYEADALARFLGARLPTEAEWEVASLAPGFEQAGSDCWQWTASSYRPYPGFRVPEGPVGEYNGKFMSGTMVLRGGSCFTPAGHLRPTYRNFWAPETQFQMSGLRLALDGR